MNALDSAAASRELLRCCGSTRWANEMAAARPFSSRTALADRADRIWRSLDKADWLEAFAAHPRIGDSAGRAGGAEGVRTEQWSAQEQAGVADDSRRSLVERNRAYEQRFHHIFIVCATGKRGDEMLDILERRMLNTPDAELGEAAEQQRQITRLRLEKLVTVD